MFTTATTSNKLSDSVNISWCPSSPKQSKFEKWLQIANLSKEINKIVHFCEGKQIHYENSYYGMEKNSINVRETTSLQGVTSIYSIGNAIPPAGVLPPTSVCAPQP